MQVAKVDMGRILKLSGALRINVVEELRAALLEYAGTVSMPLVNLSEVTECDTAGLQLLISATRTARHSAAPFQLLEISAAVREAGASLGLSVTATPPDAVADKPQGGFDAGLSRGCEDAL